MMVQSQLAEIMFSITAEKAVVGGMMQSTAAIDAAAALHPTDFTLDTCRRIFVAIRRLHEEGSSTDTLTVIENLKRTRQYDAVGGHAEIMFLTEGLPRNFDVGSQVRIVREKAKLRRLVNLCEAIVERAQSGDESNLLLNELQTATLEQQAADCDLRPVPIAEIIPSFIAGLRENRESPGLRGISTGIPDLDDTTSGWRDGELTYVGALPGRGKTAFMVQMMHTAAQAQSKVGFISLEMTSQQILRRLATIHTRLHPSRFRDASNMSEAEWQRMCQGCWGSGGIGETPIEIFDGAGLRVNEVAAVARRMHANGCRIIFVDFIQRIRQEGKDAREAINRISSVLVETCKALQVPFVVASQLARRDSNPNRRPTMQDLRESGNLEQDAHNVLLLYRPQDSNTDTRGQESPPSWSQKDEIIVAKQREGLTGSVDVTFVEHSLTFQPRVQQHGKRAA